MVTAQHTDQAIKVGFVCLHNPFDRTSFSGTASFAANALKAVDGIDLHILGPHRPLTLARRIRAKLLPEPVITPDQFDISAMDAVVGLVASDLLDGLNPDQPFFHVTDATPVFLRDVYGWHVDPDRDVVEKRIAASAEAIVYSSYYMAERAASDLSDDVRTAVAPFGVNFSTLPTTRPQKAALSPLKLLFVCSDWVRKGGDTVLAILDQLAAENIPAELIVAGKAPESLSARANVTCVGFLNKNSPEGMAKLLSLYEEAHLFLLPSRGDCTPMVVAEAMSHGAPVLASDTGGMATLITPGSGAIMAQDATVLDWVAALKDITASPERYEKASAEAFAHATETLTWDNWAQAVADLCKAAVQKP